MVQIYQHMNMKRSSPNAIHDTMPVRSLLLRFSFVICVDFQHNITMEKVLFLWYYH